MARNANTGSSRGSGARGKTSARSSGGSRSQKTKAAKQRELEAALRKRQSIAVVLFAISVLFLLLILFPEISHTANDVLHGLFGVSALVWCAVMFYSSVVLAIEPPETSVTPKISKAVLLALFISSFIHAVTPSVVGVSDMQLENAIEELYALGVMKLGAGVVGGALGALMVSIFGRVLSIILIVLVAFVIVMLMTGTGLGQLFRTLTTPVRAVSEHAAATADVRAAEREERMARRAEREEIRIAEREERLRQRIAERERLAQERAAYEEELRSQTTHRARFELDVPLDDPIDEPPFDEPEVEVVTPELPLERVTKKPARKSTKKTPQPTEEAAVQEPQIADEDFERLLEKVAGQSKRQRAEEIARQAAGFAQEVNSADEQPAAEYHFPTVDLLIPRDEYIDEDIRAELKKNSDRLISVLSEYGVKADIVDICRGPAVTRYEVCPAPGVKINRITNLTDDIALRLAATAIRLEAPIPGKSAVGVEIPNDRASIVRISELIDTPVFRDAKSPVTVAIGKDIDGRVILADLADMPHLLVAGSTGMGKSVCINSMLISMIFKSSPEDVRLIMVDPKKVELDVYNGIPHLLVPVVTDPKKAAGALQWAVGEMEKRYSMLLERGVRNIKNYNKEAERTGEFAKLPRIIIIIDELADLMSNSPKEVENSIATLAAKARAAGIHMVLATQRPSVDVITGTIKNNIPSRIAFKVTSQVDSRTILDEGGADGLIGKGDMLFKPTGSKALRVQGGFVDDKEVEDVVAFIKSNGPANYDEEIAREIERRASADGDGAPADDDGFGSHDDDPLFMKAAEAVVEAGQASVSLLQRKLTIGYARAGRIVDQLEKAGIVGPYEGSKPRQVLMSRQQLIEMTMARDMAPVKTAQPQQPEVPPSMQFEQAAQEWDDADEVPFEPDMPTIATTSKAQSSSFDEQLARAAQVAEQMRMEKNPDAADVPVPPHIEELQQSAVKITVMPSPFGKPKSGGDE